MLLQSWVEGRSREPVRGLRLHDLGLDQAYLNVTNLLGAPAWLYALKDACYKCPYYLLSELPAGKSTVLTVSSVYSIKARVLNQNLGPLLPAANRTALECSVDTTLRFGEFGVYDLVAQPGKCTTDTYLQPVNIYLPCLLVAAVVLFGLAIYKFVRGLRAILTPKQEQIFGNNNDGEKHDLKRALVTPVKSRIKSLDVFRGLCVIPLIFYVHGAGGYQILEHATWDGITLADWPFPWFLWIMGVCMPLVINSSLKRNASRLSILVYVIKRSALLFGIGLTVNSMVYGLEYEDFRYFNVLQRFAVMCLINAGLCALLWPRDASSMKGRYADLRVLWPQWLVHLLLHGLTLALVFFLPVPGCPTGYLGPGGFSENLRYFNCTGGAFGYVDSLVQGEAHSLHDPTTKDVYGVKAFDPEGNLPSLLTVILGIQAGTTLIVYPDWNAKLKRWSIWGVGCTLLGMILHYTLIPINKQLWSTSFSLVTGGGAFLGLALFYWLVDIKKWWGGFPFLEPGVNCLALYVGSKLTTKLWPWHWSIGPMDTHFELLADTVWACGVWLLTANFLYRRKIILTV